MLVQKATLDNGLTGFVTKLSANKDDYSSVRDVIKDMLDNGKNVEDIGKSLKFAEIQDKVVRNDFQPPLYQ